MVEPDDSELVHNCQRGDFDALPYTHRAAVALRYFTGLSEAEVAQALAIPVGTVKSRLHNARTQLHGLLTADDTPAAHHHQDGRRKSDAGRSKAEDAAADPDGGSPAKA